MNKHVDFTIIIHVIKLIIVIIIYSYIIEKPQKFWLLRQDVSKLE